MATTQEFQARLRRAVNEAVQKVLAEGDLPAGEVSEALFTIIENLALAAGDAVSLEVFEQKLHELECGEGAGPYRCPECDRVGKHVGYREREITTRRGLDVPLRERECYCPGCRRAFFPQCRELGLEVDYHYSPSVCRKIVRAGTKQASFEAASEDLLETGEIRISVERVRRLTERVGDERVAERASQAAAFAASPLPERAKALWGQTIPDVACVQMDGGRLQIRDRQQPQRNDKHTFWREFKADCLWSMQSEPGTSDPCPQLPSHFVDPQRMQRLVREIKGFSGPEVRKPANEDLDERPIDERPKRPEPVARSVVANQRTRMNYPAYRQQGLPITSSYVESTVKQLNRRDKGTEKFWSLGAVALTTLTGDHLSDTPTLARFWRNRPQRLTGTRGPNPPTEVAA